MSLSNCTKCNTILNEGANFCSNCGTQVRAFGAVPESKDQSRYAERKQLTVMFSDLAGSTPLSEKLDPEEMREILSIYQSECNSFVKRYGGYVAKFLGDGVLAYFGYPETHEDDARRGVSAGLGLIEAMRNHSAKFQAKYGVNTDVRVGIHTGLVIVGDMGGARELEPDAVVGKTPNLAARIQTAAELNTVFISNHTYKLVEGHFECEDMGTRDLRGIAQPVQLYRVKQALTTSSRIKAMSEGLTPFTGRTSEMDGLEQIWQKANEGSGQVMIVNGEAGVGKSRIVHSIKEIVESEGKAWITELHCSQYYANSSFYPIIDLIERGVLHIVPEEKPEEKLKKIEDWVVEFGMQETSTIPLLAALLSVPIPENLALQNITPVRQKENTIDLLISIVLKRALAQPVLFIVEDLHWADPSTLELLEKLIERSSDSRIMSLFTHRPVFTHTWPNEESINTMNLARMPRSDSKELIRNTAKGIKVPTEVLDHILEKTDGIPLFLEELTKMMMETDMLRIKNGAFELAAPLEKLPVPATLQDSLAARLDRMKEAKPVAQLAAAIGREFTLSMIDSIPGRHRQNLTTNLSRLVDAGLLIKNNSPTEPGYIFKHALIQDSAYRSLLKSSRREFHQAIAESFESNRPEVRETQPELIAYHLTEAESPKEAMFYWQKAGELAMTRSAMTEAVSHFTKAVEQSLKLPEGADRLGGELMAQTYLGLANMQTWGYGHADVEKAFSRARDLCKIMGDPPQIFPVLHGLVKFRLVRGEFVVGLELARQLEATAEETGDVNLLIEALYAVGAAHFWMGNPIESIPTLDRLISNYDPIAHKDHAIIYGEDPYVVGRSHNLWQKAICGEFASSLQDLEAAEIRVQELNHPWTTDYMLVCKTRMLAIRGDLKKTEECSIAFRESALEHGFPWWVAAASLYVGWSMAHRGEVKKGLEMAISNVAMWRMMGAELAAPSFLLRIAEIQLLDDNPTEAIVSLDEALSIIVDTREGLYEAEIYRTKGVALSILDQKEEGLIEMKKALEVAMNRGQRLWLLKAATSHVRLCQQMEIELSALQTLEQTYNWFTEGHEMRDLSEARKLLNELAR